jgi:hypothetical protein
MPKKWGELFYLIPSLMAAGVALSFINTKAVFEALIGKQTAFARTPKYAIAGNQKIKVSNDKYKSRSGWLPYAEIAAGTYFLGAVYFAYDTWNYLSMPFLSLFVFGYYWAGFATLWGEYQGKLQFERQQALATAAAKS